MFPSIVARMNAGKMVSKEVLWDQTTGHECWLLCYSSERSSCLRPMAQKTGAQRLVTWHVGGGTRTQVC